MVSLNRVKIIADSTCDLPEELLRNNQVEIVPLYVEFGSRSFKDGEELIPSQLFEFVEDAGVLPKTASPTPYDYQKVYDKYVNQDYDIIVLTLSSKMSSSFQNAVIAATEFQGERIRVLDSQNATTGFGFLVLLACDYVKNGLSSQEIMQKLEEVIPRVKVDFGIDTLEYLYKGGRCNAVQNLLGNILKIHPIITITDGRMIVGRKVRGDKNKIFDKLLDDIKHNKGNMLLNRIIIPYSWGSEKEAEYLKKEILEMVPGYDVITSQVGCVISSHCGNNAIGISYCLKQ